MLDLLTSTSFTGTNFFQTAKGVLAASVSPLPVAGHVTRTTVEEAAVGEAGAEDNVSATNEF